MSLHASIQDLESSFEELDYVTTKIHRKSDVVIFWYQPGHLILLDPDGEVDIGDEDSPSSEDTLNTVDSVTGSCRLNVMMAPVRSIGTPSLSNCQLSSNVEAFVAGSIVTV
jgi:hypothetical protein